MLLLLAGYATDGLHIDDIRNLQTQSSLSRVAESFDTFEEARVQIERW